MRRSSARLTRASRATSAALLFSVAWTLVGGVPGMLELDGGIEDTYDPPKCHSKLEWMSRSIYQIMTDRYSTDDGVGGTCNNTILDFDYCGGTFRGIEQNLDFISSMGFDAIWISPISANAPRGYHGYWPSDLYSVNPRFSSKKKTNAARKDLRHLVNAAHKRGMWVMLDSVPNHMGGPTTTAGPALFRPFNRPSHYHQCGGACDTGCPTSECGNGRCTCKCNAQCQIHQTDFCVESCQEPFAVGVEECREAEGLLDLNQTNKYVRDEILNWHNWALKKFRFDGFRMDSTKHIGKTFWAYLQSKIPCYMVGEVFQGNPCFVGPYQKVLDGLLNYPLYYAIRDAFGPNKNMNRLGSVFDENLANFKTALDSGRGAPFLGNFLDNHDVDRACLELGGDELMLRGELVYLLLAEGIPIVYQGTEKLYGCNGDGSVAFARNRRPLWWDGGVKNAPLADLIAKLNCWRKAMEVWKYDQKEGGKEDNIYVFTRGPVLVALTNQREAIARTLPGPSHNWRTGDSVCNVLNQGECSEVNSSSQFVVSLANGQPKVFVPKGLASQCDVSGSWILQI